MRFLGLLLGFALTAAAQLEPGGAGAVLYFPQLADGGSPAREQWQTSLTFIHAAPWSNETANVLVEFFDDEGRPLALDFGSGPASSMQFTIPAKGMRRFRSRMVSSTVVTGWARAFASLPVQGTVAFRQFLSGRAAVELTAHGTLPTHTYSAPANAELGIALGNPDSTDSVTLEVMLRNTAGSDVGRRSVTLPPLGHRSFNLGTLFGGLAPGFYGLVEISHATRPVYFVGWAVHAEGGLMSTLPSGNWPWPPSHKERIYSVYVRVTGAARLVDPEVFGQVPQLLIGTERQINAYAFRTGDRIQINLATSQLFSDAEAELAYVVAHELGHIYQFRTGRKLFSSNDELDADAWAALLLLASGYEPYAAAGALGRLQLAAGAPGLLGEFVRDLVDPHRSFSTRIDRVFQTLRQACAATTETRRLCETYRSLLHPNFPSDLPLWIKDGAPPLPDRH
ncbi:MAG: M48 family metalloprotease [Bryobacterales bacterium]|nr:M48 family metalloprotease [Bryobacterales bacterium]